MVISTRCRGSAHENGSSCPFCETVSVCVDMVKGQADRGTGKVSLHSNASLRIDLEIEKENANKHKLKKFSYLGC